MAYIKRIVCFAISYKRGGRCIAGKVVGSGEWIRPVSDRPTEELNFFEYCYEDYTSPRLLDVIDVPLLRAAPHTRQTENHVIQKERWVRRGTLPRDDLEKYRESPESIWANTGSTKGGGLYDCMSAQIAAQFNYSLLLIRRKLLTVEVGTSTWEGRTTKTCRGRFTYRDVKYGLKITDPVVVAAYKNKEVGEYAIDNVYLCLSLTEPYKEDGRCHKLIASVFTNSAP